MDKRGDWLSAGSILLGLHGVADPLWLARRSSGWSQSYGMLSLCDVTQVLVKNFSKQSKVNTLITIVVP